MSQLDFDVKSPTANILRICEKAQEALHLKRLFAMNWLGSFLYIGQQALSLLDNYSFNTTTFANLLLRKSQSYGDEPIESWGSLGVIIRIDSKVHRLMQLQGNTAADGESEFDTIQDILGYAVLGVRYVRRGHSPHTLAEDRAAAVEAMKAETTVREAPYEPPGLPSANE